MQALSFRASYTTLVSAALLLGLTACGGRGIAAKGGGAGVAAPACTCGGNVTIKVNHATHPRGVDQKAVYLCEGYKITWQAESGSNIEKFEVEFVGPDFPFGSATVFDSDSTLKVSTPNLPHLDELTVFKYKITITDSNHHPHPFDPHVIGGGG